ncbi:hypothetical protein TRVL_05836 [Trypanosoma vivax]|nr:hypothetical protein TRVL_05836 [Trypanosoma vivax]
MGREYRHGRSHSRERERELGMDRRRGRSHSRERELGREYRRGRSHSRERELGRDRRRGRHRSSSSESRRRRKRSISPIDQNDKWRYRRRYCPASLDKGRDSDYYHDTERHDASYRLPRSRSYERQTESCSRYERRLHRNKSPLSRSASRNGSVGPCAAKSVHVSEMGQLSRLCQPPSAAGAQVHAAGHSNAEVLLGVGAVTEQPTENHEVVPCSLQRSVPVLIATHQAFIEALQSVHGKAEALPIERVRVFCVTDADRVAQPNSQAEVPASWWISLSNSVDVDCQYLISSGRMYEEVNNWLRDTLMRGSPDVVNRYRQRDDTAWFGVQHSVDVVNVEVDTACGQQRKMYEYVEEAKLKRLAEIIMRHFATASGRTSTELMARSVDDVTDSNLTTATTKGIAIMVSSRKEQEVVLSRLLTLLQDRFGFVRCTCSLEDFQRGSADVLITYDWAILVAHESSKASGVKSSRTESSITGPLRFPTMVVNYGFPRVFLEPGKEESLLECLVMRTRALLKGYGTADGTIRRTNQTGPSPDSGSPMVATKSSVLTLLTERQAYGRLGRLFVQRAQALATP